MRTPKRPRTCWICYDDGKWNLENFGFHDRATLDASAATATPSTLGVQPGPLVDGTQEQILDREELEDDGLDNPSSSSDEDDFDDERASKTRSTTLRSRSSSLSSLSSLSSSSSSSSSAVSQLVPSSARPKQQLPQNSEAEAAELLKEGTPAPNTSVPSHDAFSLPGNPAHIWQQMQSQREQQQQQHEHDGRQTASAPTRHSPVLPVGHHTQPPTDVGSAEGHEAGERPDPNADPTDHAKVPVLVKEIHRLAAQAAQRIEKTEREIKLADKRYRRELRKIRKKSLRDTEQVGKKLEDTRNDLLKAMGRPDLAGPENFGALEKYLEEA